MLILGETPYILTALLPDGGTSTPRRLLSPPARASQPSSWPGPGQQQAHYNSTLFSAVPFVLTEGNIHDPLVLINHLITSDYVVQEPHSL